MAKTINNIDDLTAALMSTLEGMTNHLAERVYETLNHFLREYYQDYTPNHYKRTEDFLRSAVKVKAKKIGSSVKASVYIDYNSLDDYKVSGHQVVTWANQGLHGGLNVGNGNVQVWDDTMDNTVNDGTLLKLAVDYLRSCGFEVGTFIYQNFDTEI